MRTHATTAGVHPERELSLSARLAADIHKAIVDQPDAIGALAELFHVLARHPAFARQRHGDRALRTKEAIAITGFGRSHFYAIQNEQSSAYDPSFPKPFRVGCSPRWWESSVRGWLELASKGEE